MLSKFSRQQEDSAKGRGPSSLGGELNHKREGGEARGVLETTSEPLQLVLRFGEVDWSCQKPGVLGWGGVRENSLGLSVTPTPPPPPPQGKWSISTAWGWNCLPGRHSPPSHPNRSPRQWLSSHSDQGHSSLGVVVSRQSPQMPSSNSERSGEGWWAHLKVTGGPPGAVAFQRLCRALWGDPGGLIVDFGQMCFQP